MTTTMSAPPAKKQKTGKPKPQSVKRLLSSPSPIDWQLISKRINSHAREATNKQFSIIFKISNPPVPTYIIHQFVLLNGPSIVTQQVLHHVTLNYKWTEGQTVLTLLDLLERSERYSMSQIESMVKCILQFAHYQFHSCSVDALRALLTKYPNMIAESSIKLQKQKAKESQPKHSHSQTQTQTTQQSTQQQSVQQSVQQSAQQQNLLYNHHHPHYFPGFHVDLNQIMVNVILPVATDTNITTDIATSTRTSTVRNNNDSNGNQRSNNPLKRNTDSKIINNNNTNNSNNTRQTLLLHSAIQHGQRIDVIQMLIDKHFIVTN